MFVDAHCHFDLYKGQELRLALEETRNHNILTLSTSMDPEGYSRALRISRNTPLIIPCFGIHPWNAPKFVDKLETYAHHLDESPILGEIGLDFHFVKETSLHPFQHKVFEHFLKAAKIQDKLINLHTKGAETFILDYLRGYRIHNFIIHWYSGDLDLIDPFLDLGGTFTVGTALLTSKHIQELAALLPPDRLLTETDNPGAWEWQNQQRGMPSLIRKVIHKLAEIRDIPVEQVENQVLKNLIGLISNNSGTQEKLKNPIW